MMTTMTIDDGNSNDAAMMTLWRKKRKLFADWKSPVMITLWHKECKLLAEWKECK